MMSSNASGDDGGQGHRKGDGDHSSHRSSSGGIDRDFEDDPLTAAAANDVNGPGSRLSGRGRVAVGPTMKFMYCSS